MQPPLKRIKEYLHSPMCDIVERIIAAGELDMSLATEMAEMMNKTINFNSINEVDDDDCYVDMDLEIEEGYLENMALISTLNQVFLDLRGTSHIQYKRK